MTKNRTFKRLVRDRMATTGERYSTARTHILGRNQSEADPSRFDSVTSVGGQQPDLASARNLCANAGVDGPDGDPLSEAMAFGMAGGIGFLYAVFEYAEGPTMTIVARNKSMPDLFCEPLFARVGARIDVATTGSTKRACAHLDQAIADQQPALCTVGAGALRYLGEWSDMAGMTPHLVGVVGSRPNGDLLIDDRSPRSIVVARDEFDTARAAYAKAKHRMITIVDVDGHHDWIAAIESAVSASAFGFNTPPVPQFASNVGIAGLEKFRRLLTDTKDSKGWPKVFPSGRLAAAGLGRLYECIDHVYTSPSAGRVLYADFLQEAAGVTGRQQWREAAEIFRDSGDRWSQMAKVAIESHPNLTRFAHVANERTAQLDSGPDPEAMTKAAATQQTLIEDCDITPDDARNAFESIASILNHIIEAERVGLELLGV